MEAALDAHRRTRAPAGATEHARAEAGSRRFTLRWPNWQRPSWLPLFDPRILLGRGHPILRNVAITIGVLVSVVLIGRWVSQIRPTLRAAFQPVILTLSCQANSQLANRWLLAKLSIQPSAAEVFMARMVRGGLIQATLCEPATSPVQKIKKAMIDKHVALIDQAAQKGVEVVCLQELFYGPYFCAEQETRWYDVAEAIPDGPIVRLMQEQARKLRIALIVPIFEREQEGIYYNAAAVIGNDGNYLGKYRKTHIPHVAPGFWEKFYFRPGNLGYPVFDLGFARIGVYICYDRHFPEGARALGLNGAEIVFNPSATVAGLSEHLWKLEQPAHAVANGYFIGAINRVGVEEPWNIGEFYGSSYFCNPRGQIVAQASRDKDEVLTADLALDLIGEVRKTWQFFRDRRPDQYESLVRA